jgi:hypothetical protein
MDLAHSYAGDTAVSFEIDIAWLPAWIHQRRTVNRPIRARVRLTHAVGTCPHDPEVGGSKPPDNETCLVRV